MGTMHRRLSSAAAAVILISAVATAVLVEVPRAEATDSDDDVIHACVNTDRRDSGDVHIVRGSERCPRGWSRVTWSVRGPRGHQGPRGERGPKGDTGPQGPAGPAGSAGDNSRVAALEQAVAALQTQIQTLQGLLTLAQHLRVELGTINNLVGPHVILEGANLHVRSGTGASNAAGNGRGNLIVGYNEAFEGAPDGYRGGSHNVVVGTEHTYSSTSGLVSGYANAVTGEGASVLGGAGNVAQGISASVAGGLGNSATGDYSAVLGGEMNESRGFGATVAGGNNNLASGGDSSVSGGVTNRATATFATVGGGSNRQATGPMDWAAGTLFQDQ